ncbi:TonB-dependent receptor plug domain-containing protein [Dawidia soli]|uniref:TonB-dependent receptor n=1 Tax=Dawidia soli TaxID=2782352 RepID=A0AAP2D4C5_9BACT|nr:TonB-dependent receptor [Dawidia soli]MBT1685134.1 TonB-dependent receptor [Dawidia soli]
MMIRKLLAATGCIFCLASAAAQESPSSDTLKLDKLLDLSFEDLVNVTVVTPTRNNQKQEQAPATVLVITKDLIKIRGYRNLAEVLNDLPGFLVKDKSDPQFYNPVGLRGISRQDYFTILLDGVRISSPTNEALPILENYPIQLAKQIEVVYGPGSALYGADAMAGVINIITQRPGKEDEITAAAMGGTQGYSNTSLILNKSLKSGLRFCIAGLYSYDAQPDFSKTYPDHFRMDSHETGVFNTTLGPMTPRNGTVERGFEAPVKAYNVYASLAKDGFTMTLLHHYTAVPTSTTLSPDDAVFNRDVFYGHGVTTASAAYTAEAGKVKSVSTLTGSFYEVNPKSNFRNLYGGMEHGYKYSTGSMLKIEEQLIYSFSQTVGLTGGATYEIFQSLPKTPELQYPVSRTGARSGVLLNSVYDGNPAGIEAKFFPLVYTNVGSYLQVQYNPVRKISFTVGGRYDYNSRFGATVNPRIGSVFQPFQKTTIKALYGTAYWAPSPMVTYESFGSFYSTDSGATYRSRHWHLPNPNLKPTTSQTVEVSINQKIGKDLSVTLTGYSTKIKNIIQPVADEGNTNLYGGRFLGWEVDYIEVPMNKSSQHNYGGNLSVNATFTVGRTRFMAYSSLSYLEGEESNLTSAANDVEQPAITPWQYRLGIDGKLKAFYFSARLLQSGRQRMYQFRSQSERKRETTDGYSLVNISAGYTYKSSVTIFMNVQNALNQRYVATLPRDLEWEGSFQNPLRAAIGVRAEF